MKNPFIKNDNSSVWIAAAVTGALAAGTAAWYYIKRTATRKVHDEHTTDYLKPAPLPHKKSDVEELHTIATT